MATRRPALVTMPYSGHRYASLAELPRIKASTPFLRCANGNWCNYYAFTATQWLGKRNAYRWRPRRDASGGIAP